LDSIPTNQLETFKKSLHDLPNIKLFSGHFGNPGEPRNVGMANASGKWISFIDSDDKTNFVDFIEMITEAEKLEMDIALGSYSVEQNGLRICREISPIIIRQHYKELVRNPGIWRMAFRRSAINQTKFPEFRMGEDQVFLARLRFWSMPAHISPKCIYTYRKDVVGQLTSNNNALYDLAKAQAETLNILISRKSHPKDTELLSIMLMNQVLTSLKRLGVHGLSLTLRTIYKSTQGTKSFRLSFLIFATFFSELFLKIRTTYRHKGQ
jgi:glycosyltransferase involved in cell wall biosynthesis